MPSNACREAYGDARGRDARCGDGARRRRAGARGRDRRREPATRPDRLVQLAHVRDESAGRRRAGSWWCRRAARSASCATGRCRRAVPDRGGRPRRRRAGPAVASPSRPTTPPAGACTSYSNDATSCDATGANCDVRIDEYRSSGAGANAVDPGDAAARAPRSTTGSSRTTTAASSSSGPTATCTPASGTAASGGDPDGNGQNRDVLLGKILRIDPRASGLAGYTSPPSNPFFGPAIGRRRGLGLRAAQPVALRLRPSHRRPRDRRRRPEPARGGRLPAGGIRRRGQLRLEPVRGQRALQRSDRPAAVRLRAAGSLLRPRRRRTARSPAATWSAIATRAGAGRPLPVRRRLRRGRALGRGGPGARVQRRGGGRPRERGGAAAHRESARPPSARTPPAACTSSRSRPGLPAEPRPRRPGRAAARRWPAPAGVGPAPTGAAPAGDRIRPVVTRLRMARRTFAVSRRSTAVIARARTGRRRGAPSASRCPSAAPSPAHRPPRAPGRRVGKRCVAPTRRLRRRQACTRYLRAGTLTRSAVGRPPARALLGPHRQAARCASGRLHGRPSPRSTRPERLAARTSRSRSSG